MYQNHKLDHAKNLQPYLKKMLQNESSVAKIGFDAAEKGPSEVWSINQPPSLM